MQLVPYADIQSRKACIYTPVCVYPALHPETVHSNLLFDPVAG
jgi:hypothetical protein